MRMRTYIAREDQGTAGAARVTQVTALLCKLIVWMALLPRALQEADTASSEHLSGTGTESGVIGRWGAGEG